MYLGNRYYLTLACGTTTHYVVLGETTLAEIVNTFKETPNTYCYFSVIGKTGSKITNIW